jgi:FixJ family two-component response regulator
LLESNRAYESCAFCSAEEFLTSPRLHDASCLITDVQMQGMSGLELQDELAVRRPDMPVILITAFPEERVRKHAVAAGAVAFFSKPVDGHAFVGCLDAALRSSGGSNQRKPAPTPLAFRSRLLGTRRN